MVYKLKLSSNWYRAFLPFYCIKMVIQYVVRFLKTPAIKRYVQLSTYDNRKNDNNSYFIISRKSVFIPFLRVVCNLTYHSIGKIPSYRKVMKHNFKTKMMARNEAGLRWGRLLSPGIRGAPVRNRISCVSRAGPEHSRYFISIVCSTTQNWPFPWPAITT